MTNKTLEEATRFINFYAMRGINSITLQIDIYQANLYKHPSKNTCG